VQHFEFTDWDAGSEVPRSPGSFVAFVEEVNNAACSDGPILLHCRFVVADEKHVPSVFKYQIICLK